MEEQKRYRNSFIMLTLLSVAGIMTGLYLYEYTGFFTALRGDDRAVLVSKFDFTELLLLFFDEVKLAAMLFGLGFTLFAPYGACALILYKGFVSGFSVLYFGMHYQNGAIDKLCFGLICAVLVLVLTIYIIIGAKAVAFACSLRYAAPELASVIGQKNTGRYVMTFLLLCGFLFILLCAKLAIPIIVKEF